MLTGLYSAASALRAAEFQQDVIATNLAHMNVPGYRRSAVSLAAFEDALMAGESSEAGYGSVIESLAVDFTAGPLVTSSRSLDVALGGDGFLSVQGETETLYTRNGALHVDGDGTLVGTHGMPVLGKGGRITIPPDVHLQDIVISRDGTVSAAGTTFGQLETVAFEDNAALEPVGTTLFAPSDSAVIADTPVAVLQGMREQSNVQPVDELVSMIVALRYHEAAKNTLKTIDDAVQQQTDPQG